MNKSCIFSYSKKTKSFNNKNQNDFNNKNFIEHKEINKIIWEFPHLYFITKNNKLYRIEITEGRAIFEKENIISITSSFSKYNYLTQNHLILKNDNEINLPQLDVNDKIINFATTGDLDCCFLLTERGKVFIYGLNGYGIFGCKNLKEGQAITSFMEHTELEEKIKSKIVDIKCGYSFCVIKCENGDCYGSGYNYYRDFGITTMNELHEFTLLKEIEGRVKQYYCGHFSCVFLTFDGDVYVCGKQSGGQFGINFPLNNGLGIPLTKLKLNGNSKFKSVMCCGYHSTFLTKNNTILCCNQSLVKEKYNFPIKKKDKLFIELDCDLNDFIGKFGERKDEIIEIGVQMNKNVMWVVVLCKDFGQSKSLHYFENNLKSIIGYRNLSDINLCLN